VVSSQESDIFYRISEIYKIKSILENYIQNSDVILESDKKLLTETLNLINDEIRTAAITLTQRVVSSQESDIFYRISEIYKIKSILENYIQNSDVILELDKKLLTETLNLINGEIRTAVINSIVTARVNSDPEDSMLRIPPETYNADNIYNLLTESDKKILSDFLIGTGILSPTITSEDNISRLVTRLFIDHVANEYSPENILFIISAINLLTSRSVSRSNYQQLSDAFIAINATNQVNLKGKNIQSFKSALDPIANEELTDDEKKAIDASLMDCMDAIVHLINTDSMQRFILANNITLSADKPFSFDPEFFQDLTTVANQQRLLRGEDAKAIPVFAAENIDRAAQSQEGETTPVETAAPTLSESKTDRKNEGSEIANSLNSGQDAAEENTTEEVSVDSKVEAAAKTGNPASSVEDVEVFNFDDLPVRGRSATVRGRSSQDSGSKPRGGGGRN